VRLVINPGLADLCGLVDDVTLTGSNSTDQRGNTSSAVAEYKAGAFDDAPYRGWIVHALNDVLSIADL
jgi:hypothetical protein